VNGGKGKLMKINKYLFQSLTVVVVIVVGQVIMMWEGWSVVSSFAEEPIQTSAKVVAEVENDINTKTVGIILEKIFLKPPKIVSKGKKQYNWDPEKTKFYSEDKKLIPVEKFEKKFKGKGIALVIKDGLVMRALPADF
jgi:hypothetical protein